MDLSKKLCEFYRTVVHIFCKQFRHLVPSIFFSLLAHTVTPNPVWQPALLAVLFHSLYKTQSLSLQITYSMAYKCSQTVTCIYSVVIATNVTELYTGLQIQENSNTWMPWVNNSSFFLLFYLLSSFSLFHCSSRTMFTSLSKYKEIIILQQWKRKNSYPIPCDQIPSRQMSHYPHLILIAPDRGPLMIN